MEYFRVDDLKEVLTEIIARLLDEAAEPGPEAADHLAPRLEEMLRNISEKKGRRK